MFLYDSEYLTTDCENLDPVTRIIDACEGCQDPAPFLSAAARIASGRLRLRWEPPDVLGCVAARAFKMMATANAICTRRDATTRCNYVNAVSDDGSCVYPEEHYGCDGECLADTDGDGVCDPLEIAGCTDDAACNYNSAATDDDGTCAVIDECGICGGGGYLGCTYLDACNYDEDASCDDGSVCMPRPSTTAMGCA